MIKVYNYETLEDLEEECGKLWVDPDTGEVSVFQKYNRQFLEVYTQVLTSDGTTLKGYFCADSGHGQYDTIYVKDITHCKPLKWERGRYVD